MKIIGCLILVCLSLATWGQDIGRGPAFIVTLSDSAVQEIETENKVLSDSLLLGRILPIVRSIMQVSDIRQVFPCRILDAEEVNAFALPAGPIYVTMGMINLLDSLKDEANQSMLAGILGHEIAHVYLRHYVAWARMQQFIKGSAGAVPADIATILDYGYKREQEFEADELGVLYALRAGYSFESIVAFYKRVREFYGEIPPGDEKYKDHPRITERIARLYEMRGQIERDYDQFNFGVEAVKEGKYQDAITAFKVFTTTFANSACGWTNLGSAYLFEALSRMPDYPVRFMVTYYSSPGEPLRGKPEELGLSEEAFKRAVDLDTSYNIVYYGNAGIVAALNGELDQAVALEQKALEAEASEYYFYNNLGNVYFLKKDYEAAAKNYKTAIEQSEDWSLPRYNLAVLYEKVGEKDLAIGEWQALLDVSGFQNDAIKHLARLDKKFKPAANVLAPETTLAGITIGMNQDKVRKALGEPENQMSLETLVTLEYPKDYMTVFLRDQRVSGILAHDGFAGETSKGIKIGSSVAEVRHAYGLPDDIVTQTSEEQWLYNKTGMILNFYDGAVSVIQVIKAP
jgi:predicted Zn-dependent protease